MNMKKIETLTSAQEKAKAMLEYRAEWLASWRNMSFEIKPATRQGVIPLIFVWGGTGGGKTFTALSLARGMAGPSRRVIVADTENKRALLPWDRIAGGYEHIDFQPPFTPERYCELLEVLEQNAAVGVIDSLSHLWAGPDGVLEMHEEILDKMVGNDWAKREAASWRAWKEPKARLQVFKDRLMRCKIPIIGCFRGEEKSQLVKDDKGKSQIITSKTTLPIFDKKMIFEALIAFEVYQENGEGGLIRLPYPHAKVSHPSLAAILPQPETERITQAHGAKIAAWCAAPDGPGDPNDKPADDERKALLRELWGMALPVRGSEKGWSTFYNWALDHTVVGEGDPEILEMTPAQLRFVIDSTKKILA